MRSHASCNPAWYHPIRVLLCLIDGCVWKYPWEWCDAAFIHAQTHIDSPEAQTHRQCFQIRLSSLFYTRALCAQANIPANTHAWIDFTNDTAQSSRYKLSLLRRPCSVIKYICRIMNWDSFVFHSRRSPGSAGDEEPSWSWRGGAC